MYQGGHHSPPPLPEYGAGWIAQGVHDSKRLKSKFNVDDLLICDSTSGTVLSNLSIYKVTETDGIFVTVMSMDTGIVSSKYYNQDRFENYKGLCTSLYAPLEHREWIEGQTTSVTMGLDESGSMTPVPENEESILNEDPVVITAWDEESTPLRFGD